MYALLYSRPKRQPPSLTAYSPIQSTFPLWGIEADEDKVVGDEEWRLTSMPFGGEDCGFIKASGVFAKSSERL